MSHKVEREVLKHIKKAGYTPVIEHRGCGKTSHVFINGIFFYKLSTSSRCDIAHELKLVDKALNDLKVPS